MKTSTIKMLRFLSVAGLVFACVTSQVAGAQQITGSGNAIRVSPVRTDLTMKPGESHQVNVSIANLTSVAADYKVFINDFIAGDNERGQPALILDADKFAPSHSLKRYISPIPNVTVPAGQSKEVKVNITMPKDAAGGGYYGAVRFAPATGVDPTKNVTLSASVGSLVLVKVPGDIVNNMTIDSFDARSGEDAKNGSSFFTSNKSLYAVARFKNTGNVHEQPYGKVVLKKGDKVLQTTEINSSDPRGNVLPDSIRRFSVKLDKVGMWGKYTIEGNFGYADGQLVSGKSSFFVFPLLFIILIIALIIALLAALYGLPRAIKRYNAGVVRRANRR